MPLGFSVTQGPRYRGVFCNLERDFRNVHLLIQLLGSTASAGLWNFSQPLTAMAGIVDVPSGTGDRSAFHLQLATVTGFLERG